VRRLAVLGAVLGVLLLGFLAASSSASAYVGESLVETAPGGASGDTLTGPAKTILSNPTFLPETINDATATVGADEGGAVAGIFEGAGAMPLLGSVLAFTAGAGVGSYICNSILELEGCWGYSQSTANPSPGVSGAWTFKETAIAGKEGLKGVPAYSWVWNACFNCTWSGLGSVPKSGCGLTPPAGGALGPVEFDKCVEAPKVERGAVYRSAAANTKFQGFTKAAAEASGLTKYTGEGYCPNLTPTTCLKAPPANWSERIARQLHSSTANIPESTRNKIGESIAAKIEPKTIKSPYKIYHFVPNCSGLSWTECGAKVETEGFKAVRESVSWEKADLTKPAARELELKPAAGTELVTGSTVTVVTNPDESGMPIVVPQPESGETYSHYVARLNPLLAPTRHDLEAAFIDTSKGPNAVTSVSPAPETRFDPASGSHAVTITANPADAPVPAGAWTPPAIATINMGPLKGLSPCGVFPFGLFCWVGSALGQFNTTGVCPETSVPVEFGGHFGLSLCSESGETVMGYVRPAILLIFTIACGFMFARGTTAIGDD
jgi:hypothetical protein